MAVVAHFQLTRLEIQRALWRHIVRRKSIALAYVALLVVLAAVCRPSHQIGVFLAVTLSITLASRCSRT